MKCHVQPYEGKAPYLFVSYSRKDAGIAYPLIERLARAGCRVWYDAGIQTGTDWPEVIAEHLSGCGAILTLMSQNGMESHNCRNELIYAVEAGKPLIPVLYQDVVLTRGIRLMTGSVQWLLLSEKPQEGEVDRILSAPALEKCIGKKDPSIPCQDFVPVRMRSLFGAPPAKAAAPAANLSRNLKYVLPPEEDEEDGPSMPEPPREEPRREPGPARQEAPAAERPSAEPDPVPEQTLTENDDLDRTITEDDLDDNDKTLVMTAQIPPVVMRVSDGMRYRGKPDRTVLGRAKTADICIPDPSRLISNRHAALLCADGLYSIEDLESTNGTFVNGLRLGKGERVPVENCAELAMGKTRFLAAFGKTAESLGQARTLLSLQAEETGETRYLWKGELRLGRNYPWDTCPMASNRISHEHAVLSVEDAGCYLEDRSVNGTYLNGEKIPANKKVPLATGDRIRIGDCVFIATLTAAREGVRS